MEPRRRLLHVYPPGKLLFITFNLYGSLPHNRYPPAHKQSAGQAFVWMDKYLDTTNIGPLYLKRNEVAEIVDASIRYGSEQLKSYELEAYVIMANHVHLLVLPQSDPSRFLQTLKGY